MNIITLLFLLFFKSILYGYPEPVSGFSGERKKLRIDFHFKDVFSEDADIERADEHNIFLNLPEKEGLYFFKINFLTDEGKKYIELPVLVSEKSYFIFRYKPSSKVRSVSVAGSFNDWNKDRDFLRDDDGDGIFELKVLLPPGNYPYKFVIDGEKWVRDPLNKNVAPDGFGGFNSVIEIKDNRIPAPEGIYEKVDENRWNIKFVYPEDGIPDIAFIYYLGRKWSEDFKNRTVSFSLPVKDEVVTAFIWVKDKNGNFSRGLRIIKNFSDKLSWPQRIIYSLTIDRFYNGDSKNDLPVSHPELDKKANYMGGDFKGIINKIEEGYFEKLGVNALWLSPVFDNPNRAYRDSIPPHRFFTGYHGYWPVSFKDIEEHFGSDIQLKELVSVAHKRGIAVLLDAVFNHVHQEHPYYKEYPFWFGKLELPDGKKNIRRFDEYPYTTWFDVFLPSFDYTKKEPRDIMIKNALEWIKKYGFDGFRLDAVKHIPHIFWEELSDSISDIYEDFYLLGETISSRKVIDSFIKEDGLDGQFDFPLYFKIRDVFAKGQSGFKELADELDASLSYYKNCYLMSLFIGNHDFPRFISYADNDIIEGREKDIGWDNPPYVDNPLSYNRLKLAFTFILTNPGVPVIFYGDEIGLPGAGDPDNRRMMKFSGLNKYEKSVFSHVSSLNKFRVKSQAIVFGWHKNLIVEDKLWVYMKHYFGDIVIVAFNLEDKKRKITIPLPRYREKGIWVELFSGKKIVEKDRKIVLKLKPLTSKVVFLKRGG